MSRPSTTAPEPPVPPAPRGIPSGPAPPLSRGEVITLGALLALGVALRVWGLSYGVADHYVRPDEPQRVATALRICRPSCHPGEFNVPSLLFYTLGAVFVPFRLLGTGPLSLDMALVIGRLVNVLAAAATILVTFLLARRLLPAPYALWAAAILSVAPLPVREAHFVTGDTVAVLFTALSLYWLATGGLMGAAVVIGLAAGFKYTCALLLSGAAVVAWRRIVPVAAVAGAVFLATSPYVLLDAAGFARGFLLQASIARAGQWSDVSLAHLFPATRGWIHHLRFTLPVGLGLVALGLAALGLAAAVRRPRLRPLAVFTLVFYGVIGEWHSLFARYTLPLFPALAVLAAAGAAALAARVPGRARWGLALGLGAALVWEGLIPSARLDRLLGRTDSRARLQAWLDREAPREPIAITPTPPWALPDFRGRRVYRLEPDRFAPDGRWDLEDLRQRGVRRVVILEHPLAYARNDPGLLAWLRGHAAVEASIEAHRQVSLGAFDPVDAFFVPLAEFDRVIRPGPNVTIYRLADAG